MVNLVAAQKPLLHRLMKMNGVIPHAVEIDAGTVMNIWIPRETIKKSDGKTTVSAPTKPVVVLVHGFAAEGILTWLFQVRSLTKNYAVYVPDLLFFGGSITGDPDRSPTFQAECLVKVLRKLGIEKCAVVGFSYGGVVAFKMAELQPQLVEAMVISGSVVAMTESICKPMLDGLGFSSLSEFLLPTTVKRCKALFKVAVHKKLWIPNRLYKDYFEVMFSNRKERGELLEGLVVSTEDTTIPQFPQRIHLLWGEEDPFFKVEIAQKMKEQLGEKATFEGIKKAGHLVHLERPCVYNNCLENFLASFHASKSSNT